MSTLTAANAVITITIPNLFSIPQQLQGFSADDVYDVDQQEVVETMMGVDGILSGGFVNVAVKQTFTLMADSASNLIFETWAINQALIQDAYVANGSTTLPATGRVYTSTKGFLTSYQPIPSGGKLLKPRKYTITWQSVLPSPNTAGGV